MNRIPEPFAITHLPVGDGHELYVEQSGQQDGIPALFLHGGPGGGTSPRVRTFFDPDRYRIVVFDQRGAGQSRPNFADDFDAAMRGNRTPELIADIERIREHVGIERWPLVLGGSWGSTLAIAYAQAHPDRVDALVLRGIFTFERDEVDSLFRSGRVADHHPEAWERYLAFAQQHHPDVSDVLIAYDRMLQDPVLRDEAAREFVRFELSISKVHPDMDGMEARLQDASAFLPFAALEIAYMLGEGFLERGSLLAPENMAKLAGRTIRIVHGRSDFVCLPTAAWRFVKALRAVGVEPGVRFIDGAGHSDSEPGIAAALREATDALTWEEAAAGLD